MRSARLIPAFLAISCLLVSLAGCTVNPVTGESQLSIMSPAQEVALGKKNYLPSQQAQGGRYSVDPELTLYVNQVGQKLAALSDRPKLPYEFVVLNNGVPNAWALPGGKIAINRGLLLELEDEAQLAAVLSHEIVHAAARHGATQMTQQLLLGVGAQVIGIATQNSNYGELAATGAQLGAAAWQARYGREQELEADSYGMAYMGRAGYDPKAAVELQQTFVRLSQHRQSDWLQGLFASHPPSQQRVEANRAKAAQLPSGKRNRSQFQKAIAQLKQDKPAYETYEKAVEAASKESYDEALNLASKSTQLQPAEPLFWEIKGALHGKKKQYQSALSAYGRAIAANPEYFAPHLRRGLLHLKMENTDAAEKDLNTSLQYLPTQIANYHLGIIAMEKSDKQGATRHLQQAAQGGGEIGQAAQEALTKLYPPAQQQQRQAQ